MGGSKLNNKVDAVNLIQSDFDFVDDGQRGAEPREEHDEDARPNPFLHLKCIHLNSKLTSILLRFEPE